MANTDKYNNNTLKNTLIGSTIGIGAGVTAGGVILGAKGVLLGAALGIPGVLALGFIFAREIALIQHMYKGIKIDEERYKKQGVKNESDL
ncbi:MAG: hypothetical protein IKO19_10690 [Candidatus Riflebacteria bacterium]|nr:hypothetical protein [Candidatus Riflebacteria bacterium]